VKVGVKVGVDVDVGVDVNVFVSVGVRVGPRNWRELQEVRIKDKGRSNCKFLLNIN